MGRFYNCGQACLAIKRVYVFESVADEVIEAIAAKAQRAAGRARHRSGAARSGRCTPSASARSLERQIAETCGGGELLAGGGRPDDPALANGWFHEPTVVARARRTDSPMAREEVFGPALPIWRVRDLDEAIELANDSPFGLGSSVWTRDLDRAERAAAELDCGYTWINSPTKVYDELPFGGLKASGYGKEHGSEAFDFYTDQKSVVVSERQSATVTWHNASASVVDRHVERRPGGQAGVHRADATLTYERAAPRRSTAPATCCARSASAASTACCSSSTTRRSSRSCSSARCGSAPCPCRSATLDKADNFRHYVEDSYATVVVTDAAAAAAARGARRRRRCATSSRGGEGDDVVELDGGARRPGRRARPGADAPRRHGVLALQLGLDRQAEGRRAPAPRHRGHLRDLRRPGARAARGRRRRSRRRSSSTPTGWATRCRSRCGSARPRC